MLENALVDSYSNVGTPRVFCDIVQYAKAINYVKFSWGSGNIASGEFTLYGRKIT